MDILDEDLLKFWSSLNDNHVKYIMVGGFATRFHGFNRSTDDIDLWLEDTEQNRKNLRNSFIELGYGDFPMLETMEFIPGWTSFYIAGIIELDIMTNMKGLEDYTFSESMDIASIADLDGIHVPFLHINQLIANKKSVNRPKDQIDVLELEKIRNLRQKG
jgi:predicted nucleotidyltransferase